MMTADLRRAQILERIQRNGGASIAELSREYEVSPITVYRDLEQLSRQGLVERVHGGARSLSGFVTHTETDWTKRLRTAYPAKEAIGAYAGKWIEDGETTADQQMSVQVVNGCLGVCDISPVVKIDDEYHGLVTPESLTDLVARATANLEARRGGSGRAVR
jgi:DNA-binding HxlR family transcriptional regulator